MYNGTISTNQPQYFFHIGNSLFISSVISGAGKNVIKNGHHTLVFDGTESNTYTGTTYIYEGSLYLMKSPGAKAVGNVVVGDRGHSVKLLIGKSHQIEDSATVTLYGGRGQNISATLSLGEYGVPVHEYFDTLKAEGNSVIGFYNISHPAGSTNKLMIRELIIDDGNFSRLSVKGWREYADFFLVSRLFAPGAAILAKINFQGWADGAKLRYYDNTYWEIVPLGTSGAPVPEPAVYGAILGAVGLGVWTWRRSVTSANYVADRG